MRTYAEKGKKMQDRTIDRPSRKTVGVSDLFTQFRKSKSRGNRGRTFILPASVVDHIFTNSFNGSGFHATTGDPDKIKYVVPVEGTTDRNAKAYKANHFDHDERKVVASGKTMFPDSYSKDKVISIIQRALTNPESSREERIRINQKGTTETSNRTLSDAITVSGKSYIHGKADGIRIEALRDGPSVANAYPLI